VTPTALTEPRTKAAQAPPKREVEALAKRVLIVGLDGATLDVMGPLMDDGYMPNLRRICSQGTSGVLNSTMPPITPAAWTTFMTGKGPGRHGIIDFEKYDARNNTLQFNSTFEIREKTIWEILSEKGFRVGSVNVPMTYPPKKVNGFLISGFETPNTDVEFTWPPDLKNEILANWPDYTFGTRWMRKTFGGDPLFARNLDFISHSFRQGFELATFCGRRYGWDAMMVLFKLVDNLQHKAWKYLDPATRHVNHRRADMSARCFTELDKVLGDLVAYAQENEATVLMMSDHGHGSLDGKAQPNLLLSQWGYLQLKSPLVRAQTRGAYIYHRMTRKKSGRFHIQNGFERELAVDWSRTRACVMHAGMYGFLYINLKGRQPQGIVAPADYERIRDEIRQRMLEVEAPDRKGRLMRIFPDIHKPEELYNCKREDNTSMPDLLLVPAPGLAVVRKIRGASPLRWCSRSRLEGTHRREGVVVGYGPYVRKGHKITANIVDITPTLLAMLGLRVPIDMEGKVMVDMFEKPPVIEYEPPRVKGAEGPEEEVYTEAEKEALTKRLADLGYLE
jgi:predicted AlkP superfamily phosphohydrolase/phosphomutase